MKNMNKTLIPIFVCVLLSSCNKAVDEVEETPVERRQWHVVPEQNLYTVQDGDTVGSIATAHGVTRGELIKVNKLVPPYGLFAGQRLVIPSLSNATDDTVVPRTQSQILVQNPITQNSNVSIVQKGGLETEYGVSQNDAAGSLQQAQQAEQQTAECEEQSEKGAGADLGVAQELVEVDEFPISTTTYVWPVANGRTRISKAFDTQSGNVLISTPGRTPVKAIADGVVKMAGKSGNEQLVRFGNMIVIQHKSLEKVSIYANVIDLKVKAGQRVSAGDLIASVSQSGIRGMTTNPALYFEIDKTTNGKKRQPIDPCSVLP